MKYAEFCKANGLDRDAFSLEIYIQSGEFEEELNAITDRHEGEPGLWRDFWKRHRERYEEKARKEFLKK